jgi:ABC-type dipeptide/oligopeptide/nickel transport system permease component
LLEASKQRDFPIVVGLSVLFTLAVIGVGLLADVARGLIDQREVARDG